MCSEELNLNKSLIDSKKLIKNQSFMPLGNNLKIKYKKLYNIGSILECQELKLLLAYVNLIN